MSDSDIAKKSRFLPVVGIAVLGIALAIIFFGGADSITKENVERRLQQFAANIEKGAAKTGKEGKFTYGDVTIKGWGFNKVAVVKNITLQLAQKSLVDTKRWTFSTAEMLVEPDMSMIGNLFFVFPQPINAIENGQLKNTISFSAPPKYSYFEGYQNKARMVIQELKLPPEITITPVKAVDDAEKKPEHIVINYDPNPIVRIKESPDTHDYEVTYEFANLKLTSNDTLKAKAKFFSGHMNEAKQPDNQVVGKYTLTLSDLVAHDQDKTSQAYSVNADLQYHVNPSDDADSNATALQINRLMLTTEAFSVSADGSILFSAVDPLPSGNVTVNINNVPGLLSSELIPEQTRPIILTALQKITGGTPESVSKATIPLKREKNGVLYVGSTTFEELAAALFTNMLQPSSGPASSSSLPSEVLEPSSDHISLPAPANGTPKESKR